MKKCPEQKLFLDLGLCLFQCPHLLRLREEHLGLTSSFDYAGPMTETVLMGNLAIRSYMLRRENSEGKMEFFARKKLLWDGENTRITNLEEANQFVGRTYREGWKV